MLRLCREIKYRDVWRVEGTSRSLEHVLFSAGRKLTLPISAEVKEVDDTEKVKQKWRTLRFECLLRLFSFIAQIPN